MELRQQIVLVTGGGRGLDMAIARAFAAEGTRIVVNYRHSREPAEALAAKFGPKQALALAADVTRPDQVQAMFDDATRYFGQPVTTVVNSALPDYSFNGEARAKALEIKWDAFAVQLQGAVGGALNVVQAAAPAMRARHYGRIINIGSNLFQNPVVPYHDYTAAKAALLSLTRTLAAGLGPDGPR